MENGQTVKVQCPACKGAKTRVGSNKCAHCNGNKFFKGSQVNKTLKVERGYSEGLELLVPNLVDESTAEDAIFVLETVEKNGWSRKGMDLNYVYDVSLRDSVLGIDKTVQHLDGSVFNIKRETIRHGEKVTFPGKGIPAYRKDNMRGNLVVETRIKL